MIDAQRNGASITHTNEAKRLRIADSHRTSTPSNSLSSKNKFKKLHGPKTQVKQAFGDLFSINPTSLLCYLSFNKENEDISN